MFPLFCLMPLLLLSVCHLVTKETGMSLNPVRCTFQLFFSSSAVIFSLIFCIRLLLLNGFLTECTAILPSVIIVACGIPNATASKAFTIANCLARMFVHLLNNLNFYCWVNSSPMKMEIRELTTVSFLLPSVNMFTVDSFMSTDSHTVTDFAGCIQFFDSIPISL